jgi:hypothetical protein
MRYANTENGTAADTNSLDQRVRLKMVGTSGDTKLVMGLRSDNDDTTTSTRVGGGGTSNALEVDYRFLTTQVYVNGKKL